MKMSVVHPMFSLFVICVLFAVAFPATMAATTPMLETTTERNDCQTIGTNGTWVQANQSCYLFVSERMTYFEANKSCDGKGAYLVSIGNPSENALIEQLKNMADAWIGLYRLSNETCAGNSCRNWMWLDGSDSEYYNWAGNFPPNPIQCVYMNTASTWEHGRFCSSEHSFVCEKSIPLSTTTSEPTTMMITGSISDTSVSNSADNRPIIIGCVVGGLALVAIVTVVAVVLLKRHRTSRPIDQPVEVTDEDTPKVAKQVRYNPAYEDVETNVAFKPSPGNTDTGAPGNTDTGAHGVVDNPHNIYSEAIKKHDRPGSEGILVKENTLYGYGK